MWPNPEFPSDLARLTEEILAGKLHLLGCVKWLYGCSGCQCNNDKLDCKTTHLATLKIKEFNPFDGEGRWPLFM